MILFLLFVLYYIALLCIINTLHLYSCIVFNCCVVVLLYSIVYTGIQHMGHSRTQSPSYARCDEGLWPNPKPETIKTW